MYKNMLPIGSVVRIEGAVRKLMVIGRIATTEDEDMIYDYIGTPYPEGVSASDEMFFFNRDQIEELFFIGFQDPEALAFQHDVLDELDSSGTLAKNVDLDDVVGLFKGTGDGDGH